MSGGKSLAVTLRVEQVILTVRSQRVILDTDLRSQIVTSSGEGDWPWRRGIQGQSAEEQGGKDAGEATPPPMLCTTRRHK